MSFSKSLPARRAATARLSRALAVVAGAGLLALTLSSGDALAKKKKKAAASEAPVAMEIVETGVSALDDVFQPAGAMLGSLDSSTQSLTSVNQKIVAAMGLGADSSVADAIALMKEKAAGKFEVSVADMKPAVKVAEDAPDDVKAAVAAINEGGQAMADAIKALGELPAQSKELIAAAKSLPGKVPAAAKEAGLKPTELGGLMKKVKGNVAAVKGIPTAAKGTLEAAKGNVELIQSLAPAAPAE